MSTLLDIILYRVWGINYTRNKNPLYDNRNFWAAFSIWYLILLLEQQALSHHIGSAMEHSQKRLFHQMIEVCFSEFDRGWWQSLALRHLWAFYGRSVMVIQVGRDRDREWLQMAGYIEKWYVWCNLDNQELEEFTISQCMSTWDMVWKVLVNFRHIYKIETCLNGFIEHYKVHFVSCGFT